MHIALDHDAVKISLSHCNSTVSICKIVCVPTYLHFLKGVTVVLIVWSSVSHSVGGDPAHLLRLGHTCYLFVPLATVTGQRWPCEWHEAMRCGHREENIPLLVQ